MGRHLKMQEHKSLYFMIHKLQSLTKRNLTLNKIVCGLFSFTNSLRARPGGTMPGVL